MITRKSVTTPTSWTYNLHRFVAHDEYTNYLYMHTVDALKESLKEFDIAYVTSKSGALRIPVRILDDVMPGTVALPHGWKYQHSKLSVANITTGVIVDVKPAAGVIVST